MKYKLDIQKFADEGGALTFDEILSDKEYQAEFDRRVSKAIEKATSKVNTLLADAKSELETVKQGKLEAETKLSTYSNKEVLGSLGVDAKYLDFVVHEVTTQKGDKDFKEFAESYLQENKQYKAGNTRLIGSQPSFNGADKPSETSNKSINDSIRSAAGRTQQ